MKSMLLGSAITACVVAVLVFGARLALPACYCDDACSRAWYEKCMVPEIEQDPEWIEYYNWCRENMCEKPEDADCENWGTPCIQTADSATQADPDTESILSPFGIVPGR
jgi:hypothetical protein